MSLRASRALLMLTALAFAASLLLYTGLWMLAVHSEALPEVQLGFDNDYQAAGRAELITSVYKNSPAQAAGLLAGDRIVAIEGRRITDSDFQTRIWRQHKPGDQVQLTVQRPGVANLVVLTGRFRQRSDTWGSLNRQLSIWGMLPWVIVGLAVLFLRLEERNAWLLALMFGGVAVTRSMPPLSPHPVWWPFAMAYQAIAIGLVGPLFYWLYAVFPERSPIDRHAPWLKRAALIIGLVLGLSGFQSGGVRLPPPFPKWLGQAISNQIAFWLVFAYLNLGLVSFAMNFFSTHNPEARRKIRVMFWATVVGLGPNLVTLVLQNVAGFRRSGWLDTILVGLLALCPLSVAYAVLVHRVLEIPVLLKRSARYLLVQRGFTFMLSLASIGLTLLFALSLPGYLNQPSSIALGAVFGTTLLWGGTQVHKGISGRIDRAFFRGAYDARRILEDLAEKTRTVTDRGALAQLLELHLDEALKPSFLSVELQTGTPVLSRQPECAVPIVGRNGGQLGALRLGPRLSEEPYSREDQRLLASVAGQAASALDNIHLAEEIAGRIESERRAAREMEIAREVQCRLLPQSPPHLETLECAACCVQARAVGGDYYDFLDLGAGREGLVLGDVSGKGVHAALLVANLEAYLRSQCSVAPLDPVRVLQQVNQMLYRSTAPQHFATLFFGIYDDAARELLYVNCGHNPPLWLRHDGSIARLEATATVIGAFDRWEGSAIRAHFDPGDLLVVFSDGVTEAPRGEEEFGERRLIDILVACNGNPPKAIVSGILERVQTFSNGAQADDLTLLVARAM
jgi:sigma-B regulation protein RsbU (phosphoserine phosphatase)